jgi:uncharacterized spore protein YtfJ
LRGGSFGEEPNGGGGGGGSGVQFHLNFVKLYSEMVKNLDLSKYFVLEQVLQNILQSLSILYQQQFHHLLAKNSHSVP